MSKNENGLTVRPPWPRGSRWLLYLAVFLVAGLGIYRVGLETSQAERLSKQYTATATIHLRDGLQEAAQLEKIEQQIASEEMVRSALEQMRTIAPDDQRNAVASEAVKAVRRGLHVSTTTTATPGELDVAVRFTGPVSQSPHQFVNALAECYADDYRTRWSRQTYDAYANAHEATQQAQQQSLEANRRLQQYYEQHNSLLQAEQDAPTIDTTGSAYNSILPSAELATTNSANPAPKTQPQESWVENPNWIELNERLAELQQHREQLLLDRKPAHPEVRDTDLRIAAVEEQLLTTPRQIVSDPESAEVTAPPKPPTEIDETRSGLTEQERAEAALVREGLKESADRAAEAYLLSLQLERQAWQEHQRQPRIDLEYAPPIVLLTAEAMPETTLLIVALGMGLALAIGVGMVSEGAAIEPTLGCLDQVRSVLPVEVVGAIPDTSPVGQSQAAENGRIALRWLLIASGVLLIAACLIVLLRQWGG